MTSIIDPGHEYELLTIDGSTTQRIVFVKRCNKPGDDPLKFPGNKDELSGHAGTTIQSVIRVLHSRTAYLESQHHCAENLEIMECLRRANFLLESRAAKRRGRSVEFDAHEAMDEPMCRVCGHIKCSHL